MTTDRASQTNITTVNVMVPVENSQRIKQEMKKYLLMIPTNGEKRPLGANWLSSFLRHPSLVQCGACVVGSSNMCDL